MSMKLAKLLIPCLFLFCSFFKQGLAIPQLLQIPKEDREKIEQFLSYLIFDEGFVYTLFGSKPMSTIGHDTTTPLSYKELYPHPLFELESWWQIWEKYSHLFPLRGYLLFSQNKEGWFEIFFINKSNFLSTIKDNHSLFVNKLGLNLPPIEILEYVVSKPNLFKDGLHQSQALLGLLLGYGKDNSIGFEKYFSKKRQSYLPTPRSTSEMLDVENCELMIPCFSSFSNKETWNILKQYTKERDEIIRIYSNGDFLEITLNKLMSQHNSG